MKQVSAGEIRKLALADPGKFRAAVQFAASDWLKENALAIAEIEIGGGHKTRFGEWPKGWRSEMKRDAIVRAEASLIDKFKSCKIFEIDGVYWLKNPFQ